MKKRTKIIIVAVAASFVLLVSAAAVLLLSQSASDEASVYVESVSTITGLGNVGLHNRYAGIVEAQDIKDIQLDANKTLAECFVAVGDEVKIGDPLFSYDVESLTLAHEQLKIDLEGIKNNITTMNEQIADLKKQIKSASGDARAALTLQLQTLELNVRKEAYTLDKKQLEVDKAAEDITNNIVKSEIDGVVRSITPPGAQQDPNKGAVYPGGTGEESAYMTLMSSEDYRIKGTISEQTVYLLTPGMPVLIRSRVDESVTWKGTIDSVNTEQPETNNNNMYYPMADDRQQATKYAFYIMLETNEGLMMGQHVYIEPDNGVAQAQDGLWLPEPYVISDGPDFFVLADNGRDRLEKRKVTVGEFDEARGCYLITDGLTAKDFIAFPAENVAAGAKTTKTMPTEPVMPGGEMLMPEGAVDESSMHQRLPKTDVEDPGTAEDETAADFTIEKAEEKAEPQMAR